MKEKTRTTETAQEGLSEEVPFQLGDERSEPCTHKGVEEHSGRSKRLHKGSEAGKDFLAG